MNLLLDPRGPRMNLMASLDDLKVEFEVYRDFTIVSHLREGLSISKKQRTLKFAISNGGEFYLWF